MQGVRHFEKVPDDEAISPLVTDPFAGMTSAVGNDKLISDFSMFSEHIEQVLHIFGQGGLEFYHFIGGWVLEFKAKRVQCESVYNRGLYGRLGVGQLPLIDELAAVHIIAYNRMPNVR